MPMGSYKKSGNAFCGKPVCVGDVQCKPVGVGDVQCKPVCVDVQCKPVCVGDVQCKPVCRRCSM